MGGFFLPVLGDMCGLNVIERLTINVLGMDWQMRANARAVSFHCWHRAWKGVFQRKVCRCFQVYARCGAATTIFSVFLVTHRVFQSELRHFRPLAGDDCWATMAR
jgi:hypothetical protein